jgi:hypothetical protein
VFRTKFVEKNETHFKPYTSLYPQALRFQYYGRERTRWNYYVMHTVRNYFVRHCVQTDYSLADSCLMCAGVPSCGKAARA